MMSSTVWHGHSTRPSLPAGTARKASGHLSERGSSILLTQDRSVAQKPHWGFHCSAALRKRELALAGRAGSSHPQQRETERSRRGTPCCTYRCRRWIFQGASYSGAHPVFVFMDTHAVPYATSGSFLRTPSAVVSYKTRPANLARTSQFCVPSELFHLPSSASFNTSCPAQTCGNQYPSAGASS